MGIAAYLLLSLGAALAGSLAAVAVVPLVHSGPNSTPFGGVAALSGTGDLVAAFVAATVGFALMRWQITRLGARLASRFAMKLRRTVHARLIGAPLASLADATSAEIANVLTYNIEIVVQGFNALLQLLVAAVTSAVSLGFAFWISPRLVLAVPLLAAFGLLASGLSGREQSRVSRRYVAGMTRLFWLSEDFPRRLRHVRSFRREDAEKSSYGAISDQLGQDYRRQVELVANGRLAIELLAAIGVAAVFMIAHRSQDADQSSLIAASLLLGRLLPYLASTRQSFQQLRSAAPAFELWRRYAELDSASTPTAPAQGAIAGDALFIERVRIARGPVVLDIRDVVLMPGELTLISGDSGIGKSTLVDVLAGMMEPGSFEGRTGRRPIGFDDYRDLVRDGGYISQNVAPWQHSVRDCLLWAAPQASEDSMRRALADVGLDKWLAGAADGLDTALRSASSRLSGGELQRLLLAQIILRRPFLALLDEATSALDAASEAAVLTAMKRRLPQTILVVVSHRSDVASLADQCLDIGSDLVATVVRKTIRRRESDVLEARIGP